MGIETFAKVRCPWKTYSSAGECRWSIVLHDFTCMVLVKKKQKIHPPYVPYSRELKSTWPFTPSIGILGKYLTFQTRVCFFAASQFHHVSSKKPIKNRATCWGGQLPSAAPPAQSAAKKPQSWGLVTQGGYCKVAWISLTCMGKKLIKHSCDFRFKLF